MRPVFTLHLGDFIHPLPELANAAAAWVEVAALLKELSSPLHVTPGNHDIGDKPNPLMPAASVRPEWRRAYEKTVGPDRVVFDHAVCRFVLFNSPVLNADPAADRDFFRCLEDIFAGAEGRRLFVATHYPIFLHKPGEPGHYDNIDQPARGRLLDLLERHAVEAVFTGHIHNPFWHRLGHTDFHGVPSVSFVRRDYAELFRVGPLAEDGREDPEKIGFVLVDVHERGHVARFLRLRDYAEGKVTVPSHVGIDPPAPFGVDLRHPWAETVAFPFNPPTDAFHRKTVRNDYQVLALIELGIKDVRIPIEDLEHPETRSRMADLGTFGMRFTAFTTEHSILHLEGLIQDAPDALDTVELIGSRHELISCAADFLQSAGCRKVGLMVNELRPAVAAPNSPRLGKHRIDLGQSPYDLPSAEDFLRETTKGLTRAGLVFRAAVDEVDDDMLQKVAAYAADQAVDVALHVAWAAEDMSSAAADEMRLIAFIERLFASRQPAPGLRIFLDTFMEIDRGYHVRSGLIDRRANFTKAGHTLRSALADRRQHQEQAESERDS